MAGLDYGTHDDGWNSVVEKVEGWLTNRMWLFLQYNVVELIDGLIAEDGLIADGLIAVDMMAVDVIIAIYATGVFT